MIRRALVGLVACLIAGPAVAGDFASLEPIGFSPDGRVFAFEQYGVQDGSGFPYSEIVFVDLDEDAFVGPSPVRVVDEAENATLAKTRAAAREKAASLLRTYEPAGDPGYLAAANPPTEVSADPHRLVFRPRPFEPWPDDPVELTIELLDPAAPPADCGGEPVKGYRLAMRRDEGEAPRTLHEDASVPQSRNCPLDYRLSAVVVGGIEREAMRAVAIVGVRSLGFEGPNLRYLAEPVPLD